jgi:sugar phosphate isomerase/epimerase
MVLSRRNFISSTAASLLISHFIKNPPAKLPLAFSTLGCPDWEFSKILDFAAANGFAAIELRGLMGNLDLPTRPEFAPDRIAYTKRAIAAHGLKIACVSSSSNMHEAEPALREKELSDARRFIDVAAGLEAPNVRVFGNNFKGPKEQVVARVAAGLRALGDYAGTRGVTVILESHGDFVTSPVLKAVLTQADSPYVALLWDAHHTFAEGGEQPEFTVKELGQWIRHTHLKDSVLEGTERKYVLTGKGDVPVERQVEALRSIEYRGYYCFEWEKVWHPDLPDAALAFPDYVRVLTEYLRKPLKKS